jgi:hypothetical protein
VKAIIELVALSFYKDFCCPDIGCQLKNGPLYQLLLRSVKGNTLLRDLVLKRGAVFRRPTLAHLGLHGVNYDRTSTSRPSDSFPGLMVLMTGGTPRTVGAFYDVAYDRVLAPPQTTTGVDRNRFEWWGL